MKLKTKSGWWIWKREFYNICSTHQEKDARTDCPLCVRGSWSYAGPMWFSNWADKYFQKPWRKFYNRQ